MRNGGVVVLGSDFFWQRYLEAHFPYPRPMSELDLVIVALVSLAGSFIKSVTGMGYPLIAIPALTFFIGVEAAVVVIAIPNAVLNAILCFDVRENLAETRDLPILALAAVLGGALGTFVLVEAPERPLLIFLASMVLVFVYQKWRQPELTLAPETTKKWAPVVGLASGFAHGAVGASGPIVALWFHGYRLSKNAYVLSLTALFLVSGLAQLGVLIATGSFGADRWLATGVALVATLAMAPIGTRVRDRLDAAVFEQLILMILLCSGASLLWRAFS